MVLYCSAYGCSERFVKGGVYTFHSFPRDESRRRQWELNLRRKNFKATDASRICSKHFTPESFDKEKFGGTWLKKDAVPTIFNFPSHLIKIEKHQPVHKRELKEEQPSTSNEIKNSERNYKRFCYLGDFIEEDLKSPTKAIQLFRIVKEENIKRNKKLRYLRQKNTRLKKRVANFKEMLNDIKKTLLVTESACSISEHIQEISTKNFIISTSTVQNESSTDMSEACSSTTSDNLPIIVNAYSTSFIRDSIKQECDDDVEIERSAMLTPNEEGNSNERNMDVSTNDTEIRDEFSIFGEYVGSRLRNLQDRRLQLVAQHRITNLLNEVETKLRDNDSSDSD